MGGFAVEIGDLHNTVDEATLTTDGLLFLADHGCFFELSPRTIADKSKANLLAKGIVCLQVIWVAGQTIERKVAGYPVSLLELHTLVHICCALVIYTLWIQKPYDVNEPTFVSPFIPRDTLAFIVASSRWEGHSGFVRTSKFSPNSYNRPVYGPFDVFKRFIRRKIQNQAKSIKRRFKPPKDPKFHYYGKLQDLLQIFSTSQNYKISPEESPLENLHDPRLQNHFLRIQEAHGTHSLFDPDVAYYPGIPIIEDYNVPNGIQPALFLSSGQALRSGLGPVTIEHDVYMGVHVGLSDKDLNRLDLAGAFISRNLALTESRTNSDPNDVLLESKPPNTERFDYEKLFDPFEVDTLNRHGRRLISVREGNIFSGVLSNRMDKILSKGNLLNTFLLTLAVMIIPSAYGGIHLSAFHDMFPTPVELILWKASCFILLGFATFFLLSMSIFHYAVKFADWVRYENHEHKWWSSLLEIAEKSKFIKAIVTGTVLLGGLGLFALVLAAIFLYIGARIFLIVESFISLRHVPIGVYQTPSTNIMSYVIHI
jgi:hypothetical protein